MHNYAYIGTRNLPMVDFSPLKNQFLLSTGVELHIMNTTNLKRIKVKQYPDEPIAQARYFPGGDRILVAFGTTDSFL